MSSRRNFLRSAIVGSAAVGVSKTTAAEAKQAAAVADRRPLGRIGTKVSILGLGLGSAFTKPYSKDREAGHALLNKALELGVNYWDTSRGYDDSEEIIGPVLEKHRDQVFMVSKSGSRDYDGFMRDAETTLKNLRTDHLDLLHIWNLPADANIDEIEKGAFKAVTKLKDEKVIRNFGVTGHSNAKILMAAIRRFDPDAVLTVFPCTREDNGRYEDELLPLARERKMGVIAMKTVRRARDADLKGSDLIRYAISLDGVCTAIVGLDTEAHLVENAKMATNFKPMDKNERAELHRHASRALAGMPIPWLQPGYRDGSWA